jgi:hypothetical protein
LIEEGYLGMTITHTPPRGMETMREFDLAIHFHMNSLPRGADGTIEYQGIRLSGEIARESKRLFLKAKGSLYLIERTEKRIERLFTVLVAVISASLATLFVWWWDK